MDRQRDASRDGAMQPGQPRSSNAGGGKAAPRSSFSNWGPQGSMRHSHRQSMRSSRRSQLGPGPGDGQQAALQVIDPDDGQDRTPKPLLSVKPSVLKGMGQTAGEEPGSPSSEAASEFFLDRMSSAAFSRGNGWFSGGNSGAITPTKSEPDDGDYEAQRERAKAMAAAAAALEQAEVEERRKAELEEELRSQASLAAAAIPHLLTEKELDSYVTINLSETATDFLFSMPCVTVSLESEDAAGIEAANKRYTDLLANKAAADKYTDQEAQTLNSLSKSVEVQSCVLTSNSVACQASKWDIADATSKAKQQPGEGPGDAAGQDPNIPNVIQMAGAVAHGDAYGGGGRRVAGAAAGDWRTSTTNNSLVDGHSGSLRNLGSMTGGGSMAHRVSSRASWVNHSQNTMVPGMLPSQAGSRAGGPSTCGSTMDGPAGAPGSDKDLPPPPPPDPLLKLHGLLPALAVMDMALCQNTYLPKLLQYRDITPIPQRPENALTLHHDDGGASSKAVSVTASRPISRMPSRQASRQPSECGSMSASQAAPMSRATSILPGASHQGSEQTNKRHTASQLSQALQQMLPGPGSVQQQGGPPAGYAYSMTESAWPEELLQDLADLGPDGVPRMEPLWDWSCPMVAGLQVVCMAWNKKAPDLLAVGYGTQAFSKAAAATGMGSGCYLNTTGPSTATTAATDAAAAPSPPQPQQSQAALSTTTGQQPPKDGKAGAAADTAAGGDSSCANQPVLVHGMVAFWSLKHPNYPLWAFRTRSGVTSLDFATHQPNVLAVGLYDGTVAVYNIKSHLGSPAMESDSHTGRHADPVWKVQWIDRGHERDEVLVSISSDGRVTQWSIAKGLEHTDLMALKRVPRKPTATTPSPPQPTTSVDGTAATAKGGKAPPAAAAAAAEADAFISRLTSGMSFDFSARDQRMYITGTEDGWIHRCSTSYSEQYLESYEGHMGPVYALRWSPFRPTMWASASADWTIRLWQEGRPTALLCFQSGSNEVNDVQWCPTNSTVFGSVTSGGRLEVWDFGLSTVKPVVTHKAGQKLTCLLFSPNSPVVVCGSESGMVHVFRLFNVEREYDTPEEQLSRLEDVIRANVMKTQPGAAV